MFITLKVNTLLCTIHLGTEFHTLTLTNDGLYKYLSSQLPELSGTSVPIKILERVPDSKII